MYGNGMRPDTRKNRLREQELELTLDKLVIVQAYTGCSIMKYANEKITLGGRLSYYFCSRKKCNLSVQK